MAALKRGSRGLKCLQALKELELRSLPHEKPSQGEPGSSAVLQHHSLERKGWDGLCSQGGAAPKAELSVELRERQRPPGPLLQHLFQEMGAKLGCHCSKRCPGSIQTHLTLQGAWAVDSCSHRGVTLPKGKGTQIHPQRLLGD